MNASHEDSDLHKAESLCKECFGATLGSERNNRIGAPISHAFDFYLFHRLTRLDNRLPLSRANHTPSRRLHSLLPFLFLLHSLFFLRALGNDYQHLAAAT